MQPAGTISMEHWEKLHTVEELDTALKAIIRDSKPLIDVDFKSKPMHPWSEVYDNLCHEVGQAYGMNDIREA